MSSPLDLMEGIMPYSIQVNSAPGSTALTIPVGQRRGNYGTDTYHWPGEGIFQVAFFWSGPEAAEVRVYTSGRWSKLTGVPAGGGTRMVGPVAFSGVGSEIRITSVLLAPAAASFSGGFQIFPTPLIT